MCVYIYTCAIKIEQSEQWRSFLWELLFINVYIFIHPLVYCRSLHFKYLKGKLHKTFILPAPADSRSCLIPAILRYINYTSWKCIHTHGFIYIYTRVCVQTHTHTHTHIHTHTHTHTLVSPANNLNPRSYSNFCCCDILDFWTGINDSYNIPFSKII